MLSSKFVRENLEAVKKNLDKRRMKVDLDAFICLEKERLELIKISEDYKSRRNQISKEIGTNKSLGDEEQEGLKNTVRQLAEDIQTSDTKLNEIQVQIDDICCSLPNLLDDDIPEGSDESDNQIVRIVGEKTQFDFTPLDHVTLLETNQLSDFERAAKITGARFAVLKNEGAQLERALINFFLDQNLKAGYTEFHPPSIVNDLSLFGTGQLPKFKEDLFMLADNREIEHEGSRRQFYLIPTAEVPLTNLHANEIIAAEELPFKYTAYTPCFRSEAGSAGRDTRGLIRMHEFGKVEMVNFTTPENSNQALEAMVEQAESHLQLLKIPYRVALLCSGDIGFSARRCYDIEVWLPGQAAYREISSCSNCGEFQATRANIRFRIKNDKPQFVHTLNGSGLPIGRTLVAILENYQQPNGNIRIPEVLIPYMGKEIIGLGLGLDKGN